MANAVISSIFPNVWEEHFSLVPLILIHSSTLYSPILTAPVLYPTNIDAPFTTEPGVTGDVKILEVLSTIVPFTICLDAIANTSPVWGSCMIAEEWS